MNMDKINEARAKITDESQKIGGPLANFIEEHINSHCTTIDVAAKVMDRNLSDLIKKIEGEARKNKIGNIGMISDADVIEMTDEFYELKASAKPSAAAPGVVDVLDLI